MCDPQHRHITALRPRSFVGKLRHAVEDGSSASPTNAPVVPWFAAGRDLNADLATLTQQHGQNHILMETEFPQVCCEYNHPCLVSL